MSDQSPPNPAPYPQDGIPVQPGAMQPGKDSGWTQPYPMPPQKDGPSISIGLKEVMLAMGGVVVTVAISVTSWFFGNIHARLDKHETRIQAVEKDDVHHKNDIESLQAQSRRQWELIREQGTAISQLQAKIGRGQ